MESIVFYMGIVATLLLVSGFGFTMYEFSQLTEKENGPDKADHTIKMVTELENDKKGLK